MYEEYWGLAEPAFSLTPDPKFFYMSRRHEDCLTMLRYAVTGNKGAALLTGKVGCGKTTLSRKFFSELDEHTHHMAMIVNPILTPVQLLREILEQVGVAATPRNRQVLVRMLNERLLNLHEAGKAVVLIIDEAHLIKNRMTFEELRLLMNFQLNDKFLITLLLVGQPELRAKLEKIPALWQRLAVRSSVGPLTEPETHQMVDFRMRQAWYMGNGSVFTPDAVRELYAYTKGYPRLVCEIADNALMHGMVQGAKKIDGFLIKTVIMEFEGENW